MDKFLHIFFPGLIHGVMYKYKIAQCHMVGDSYVLGFKLNHRHKIVRLLVMV